MKYATIFHPDIEIDQYRDTVVSVQLVAKYMYGLPEAITIGVRSYPEWVVVDSVSSIPTTALMDTSVFNVKSLNLRLHPFNSGRYPVTFITKGATTDTQVHTINVTVKSASDCTTYLVGQYQALQDCRPKKPYFRLENVYKSTISGCIVIAGTGGGESYVDCEKKTIVMPSAPGAYEDLYGDGYFRNDSIFLHLIYIATNYKIYDTCDIIMVRK